MSLDTHILCLLSLKIFQKIDLLFLRYISISKFPLQDPASAFSQQKKKFNKFLALYERKNGNAGNIQWNWNFENKELNKYSDSNKLKAKDTYSQPNLMEKLRDLLKFN